MINENAIQDRIKAMLEETMPYGLLKYKNMTIGQIYDQNPDIFNQVVGNAENTNALLQQYGQTKLIDFQRIAIQQMFDIGHGRGPVKYLRGIFRVLKEMGCLWIRRDDTNAMNNINELKSIVMYLSKKDTEDGDSGVDKNLNGMNIRQLRSTFGDAMRNAAKRTIDATKRFGASFRGRRNRYKKYTILKHSDCLKFAGYFKGGQQWCITYSNSSNYDMYTSGGSRFYVFVRDDVSENDTPFQGEGCPLDEYGLGMVAVLVDCEGEIVRITTRWNHAYGGEFECKGDAEIVNNIQRLMNVDLIGECPPYTLEELRRMGVTPFYIIPDMLKSGIPLNQIFDTVEECEHGLKIVSLRYRYNIIRNRNILYDEWFKDMGNFYEGFAKVANDTYEWNFIDTNGNILCNEWFDHVDNFQEGFARVKNKNSEWNFVNKNGDIVCDEWFIRACVFNKGFAAVKSYKLGWNFIDTNGNILCDEWFASISDFENGLAKVKNKNSEWNFINTNGDVLLDEWLYRVGDFENGLAAVETKNFRWNFIDTNGNILCDEWFDRVNCFIDGLAKVQNAHNKWNFIDTNGNILCNEWFDHVDNFFTEGFARVSDIAFGWNFIDKNGDILCDKWFAVVCHFENGFAKVRNKNSKEWNLIDTNGKIIK